MKSCSHHPSLCLLAACLLAVVRVAAQTPAPDPGRVHPLRISVLDATTQQPVAGAEVLSYNLPTMPKAITDDHGVAVLNVPLDLPGSERMPQFEVAVNAAHYAMRRVTWISSAGGVLATLPADSTVQVSPGIIAGGVVRDAQGAPVVGAKILIYGSAYNGYRTGGDTKLRQEFSSVRTTEGDAPVTDDQGSWRKENFPADLTQLNIDVVRSGGARTRFVAGQRAGASDRSTALDLAAVVAGQAVLTLKDGVTVQGVVRNEAGQPLAGVQLRVRDALSRNPPYTLQSGPDGKFELPHWDVTSVLVTAELAGYRTSSVTIPAGADAAPGKIVLTPAQPLRLRIVDEHEAPVAGVDVRTNPNPSDQILDWKATSDADGRVEWAAAPDKPVNLWLSSKVLPFRSVKLLADGTEHVIRLRPGADKSIKVHLRVVDAGTGALVPGFEVWRRLPNQPFKTWGEPAAQGEFNQEIAATELPVSFTPVYRLQVRVAGYTGWNSDTLDFSEGDQDLTIKLTKGDAAPDNEPPPTHRPGEGISGENNPALMRLAASVASLLQTGDVAAFVRAVHASEADWNGMIPPGVDSTTGPLGKDPARVLRRREEAITASAQHVLELAQRAGLTPGRMRFDVKSVSSPVDSSVSYKFGERSVSVPSALVLRVVLAGEPVGDAGGRPLRGDYELSIGDAVQLPAGWRTNTGLRWNAFPAGVADEATLRELRLVNRATPTTFSDQRTLSEADDPALRELGAVVTSLVRDHDVPRFVAATSFTPEAGAAFFPRNGWGPPEEAESFRDRLTPKLTAAAQALRELPDRLGVDFSQTQLTVTRVLAEHPSFTHYGQLDGLRADPLQVTFRVDSTQTAKSGRPVAGTFTISLDSAVRADGHWLLMNDQIRWQVFPQDLLPEDESKRVAFENYVAEKGVLPPGHTVPEIEFVRLADGSRASLSAYRGKIVVLEFWASWCGPCQEPMEKLQHLRAAHPDWQDRVEVLTLSIDDKAEEATAHLTKEKWIHTANTWAGPGGWHSAPALAFRVRGVPTAYVIDRAGKVVQAGHTLSLDFGALVDEQLRQPAR